MFILTRTLYTAGSKRLLQQIRTCHQFVIKLGNGILVTAVNPTIYRIVTSIATTWKVFVYPSTRKAGLNVRMVITWRATIKAVATSCTASKSSSAVVCTMAAKWPTGGEDLTKKVGFSVIRQHTTLPSCGEIETVVLKRRFIYLRRQSVVQLLRQIKTRHQLAKTLNGGAFWTGKFTRV